MVVACFQKEIPNWIVGLRATVMSQIHSIAKKNGYQLDRFGRWSLHVRDHQGGMPVTTLQSSNWARV